MIDLLHVNNDIEVGKQYITKLDEATYGVFTKLLNQFMNTHNKQAIELGHDVDADVLRTVLFKIVGAVEEAVKEIDLSSSKENKLSSDLYFTAIMLLLGRPLGAITHASLMTMTHREAVTRSKNDNRMHDYLYTLILGDQLPLTRGIFDAFMKEIYAGYRLMLDEVINEIEKRNNRRP